MANLIIENIETFSTEQLQKILAIVAKSNGNVEQVVEKAQTEKKQRKAPPKQNGGNGENSEQETLHCEPGDHDWTRTRKRGRKPNHCPDHAPQDESDSSEPESESDDDSEELNLDELLNSDDDSEQEEKPQNKGGKRNYQKRNNSENMVPRNALIDSATEEDLEAVKAEIEENGGKFKFHRVGLKYLDGSKCDFAITWSKQNNCHYYKVGDGDDAVWAKYGSTPEFLKERGFKPVNQSAMLNANAVHWQKNGKSRIYVNPQDRDFAGGGWFVKPRES